ncbi:BACON domain-containing protein [Psychroserpens burtonensis]|uniref:BACON domain-containing protein n=1 Tax=Psychroserpens burtonensis TaxID=49278 RepID=A0A5C7BA93_9FLAO|nr:BACON domain-containing protein [Psychroserpens burtonensis]TXE18634.1 BACON domain-containing protein [Psychroserpens burtonensis]
MAFNPPGPYAFNYLQTQPLDSQTGFYIYSSQLESVSNITLLGGPPWLELINVFSNIELNKITFTLKINESYAYSMAEGDYSASVRLRIQGSQYLGGTLINPSYTYSTFLNVNLNVQHVTVLTLTPSLLPFSYVIGDSTPQNQTLSIESDSNWTITSGQSWVTLSSINGVGSAQIVVGVNTNGLDAGSYSALLTVVDNSNTRYATVTLTITDETTANDYLVVTPQLTNFLSILGEANSAEKIINIDASDDWSLTNSASWLNTSATTGSSGQSTITLTVDSAALTNTNISYLATVTFQSQDIIKIIYVELRILNFVTQGLANETLYYADDRNEFQVTNIDNSNDLILQAIISNGEIYTVKRFKTPYHQGVAKALFGMETNFLLQSVNPTNNFNTRIKNNFLPTNTTFQAINKNRNTGLENLIASYANVRFLKGKTPTVANKLCYIPEKVTLDANSLISLTVQSTNAITEIEVTGDYTGTFTTSIAGNLYTYNAILNLGPLNLVPGNVIEVTFGIITLEITIDETYPEINTLAFQNEWNEFELFTTKGFLTIEKPASKTETDLQVNGKVHTKVSEIKTGKDYALSTGWLHTQAEVDWLSMILDSKIIFIYQNGEPIEIILETKKLQLYKTRENLRAYQLKFKKAIV